MFAVTMFATLWWVVVVAVAVGVPDPELRIFLGKLKWFGIVFVPVGWFLFALAYTGRTEYLTPKVELGLAVVPVVTLSLALSNSLHGLVYVRDSYAIAQVDGVVALSVQPGPWFWVHSAYSYVLLLAGTGFILQLALSPRLLYRGQSAALVGLVLPPIVANAAYLGGYAPLSALDPTPFSFAVSGVAGLVALSRYGFLESPPVTTRVAQRSVVDTIDASVIAVDTQDRIVDVNPTATRVLGVSESEVLGVPASSLLPSYDALVNDPDSGRETVSLEVDGRKRYFETQVTPLSPTPDSEAGHIIVLYDVTRRRNRSKRLDVLNRVLRHNLRNEMNVVYGFADHVETQADGEVVVDAADRIKDTAMSMVEMGNKARTIDRLVEAADNPPQPRPVDEVVEWTRSTVERDHPPVAATFSVPSEPVYCDQTVDVVLEQLVENAIEHDDSATPELTVAVSYDETTVHVAIGDEGPGIPDAEQAVVAAAEETALEHGSGLGLWLASSATESLGGSLELSENYPQGTIARVSVPRLDPETAGPAGD